MPHQSTDCTILSSAGHVHVLPSLISQAPPERGPAEKGLKFEYTVEKYLRRYLRSDYNGFSRTNRLDKGRPA